MAAARTRAPTVEAREPRPGCGDGRGWWSAVRVDIWSDVVCPWCYVGKARFDRALAAFEHRDQVVVRFHSYELAPNLPRGGSEPLLEALTRKFAGVPAAEIEGMEHRVAD